MHSFIEGYGDSKEDAKRMHKINDSLELLAKCFIQMPVEFISYLLSDQAQDFKWPRKSRGEKREEKKTLTEKKGEPILSAAFPIKCKPSMSCTNLLVVITILNTTEK